MNTLMLILMLVFLALAFSGLPKAVRVLAGGALIVGILLIAA
jgi:hypothetical protein